MGQTLNFPKVYAQHPTLGADALFKKAGFPMVENPEEAHWILLGGGEDIDSSLYGEKPCPRGTQGVNKARDDIEVALIDAFRGKKTFIGICRGAQLLNVKAGGKLYQHVNNHAGSHHAISVISGAAALRGTVNSVHHQQMRPAKGHLMLGWAYESTQRHSEAGVEERGAGVIDPEIVWYPKDKFYCFQAHPEFGHPETTEIFFRSLADTMPITV
jgi:GMP synthase-like glutamine amidotransferase